MQKYKVTLKNKNGKVLMQYSVESESFDDEAILDNIRERIKNYPESFKNSDRIYATIFDGKQEMHTRVDNIRWWSPSNVSQKGARFATVTANGEVLKFTIPTHIVNGSNYIEEAMDYVKNCLSNSKRFPDGAEVSISVKLDLENGKTYGEATKVVMGR